MQTKMRDEFFFFAPQFLISVLPFLSVTFEEPFLDIDKEIFQTA